MIVGIFDDLRRTMTNDDQNNKAELGLGKIETVSKLVVD